MSSYSIFGNTIIPRLTESEYNVIRVGREIKEVFADIYECSFEDKKIILEKIDEVEGVPIVKFQLKRDGILYICKAMLERIDDDHCLMLNNTTLERAENITIPDTANTPEKKILKFESYTNYERDTIDSIENGTVIYNSTEDKFQGYAGGEWVNLH